MLQRMVVLMGVLMFVVSCQSVSPTDASIEASNDLVTATPVAAIEAPPVPHTDDDTSSVSVRSTPAAVKAEATATVRRLRLVASATSIIAATRVGATADVGLQFELVPGVNDDKRCVFVFVSGVDVTGWVIQIDGGQFALFTPIGSAFVCGLQAEQAVAFTLFDANNQVVSGAEAVSARGGDAFYATWIGERADTADMSAGSTRGLRFRLDNSNADQRCIEIRVIGIAADGWLVKGDGLKVSAVFDTRGTAELCGLNRRQEFTFSVYDAKEMAVAGGTGIPARGGDVFVAEWGDIASAQVAPTATPVPTANRALRVALKNSDDDSRCISMQISGIRTNGWVLKADGLKVSANFDGAGNARLCGLTRQQEFTFSVFDAKGGAVAGGRGIPARGSNIFVAEWR